MGKIDKTYFKWNPQLADCEIRLGASKDVLLSQGIIKEITNEGEIDYQGLNQSPWRINFKKDKVVSIWYNRDSSFKIGGIEILGTKYAEIESVLQTNFSSLNSKIRNVEEMKSYTESDILYVICRDFFVALVAVIRTRT